MQFFFVVVKPTEYYQAVGLIVICDSIFFFFVFIFQHAMSRKFSAPGQLCSLGGPVPAPIVIPPGTRKGSLCLAPQQSFPYPCVPYANAGAQQWTGAAGAPQVSLMGTLQPSAASIPLQQQTQPGYHMASSHKAKAGASSNAGRTSQAS